MPSSNWHAQPVHQQSNEEYDDFLSQLGPEAKEMVARKHKIQSGKSHWTLVKSIISMPCDNLRCVTADGVAKICEGICASMGVGWDGDFKISVCFTAQENSQNWRLETKPDALVAAETTVMTSLENGELCAHQDWKTRSVRLSVIR